MKNIYLFSIELAVNNNYKISFNSLKENLIQKKYNKELVESNFFKIWFYSNFYQKYIYESIKNGNKSQAEHAINDTDDTNEYFLCSEPLIYYQQSVSNKINRRTSLVALFISFCAFSVALIKILMDSYFSK